MHSQNPFFAKAISFLLKQFADGVIALDKLGLYCNKLFLQTRNYIILNKVKVLKAVIPLLIIGVGVFSCSGTQRTIKRNIEEIFEVSDNIRAYYASKPDYWGLSSDFVLKNPVLPAKFIKAGKIVLSGGREVFIGQGEAADIVLPGSVSFDIVMQNLSKAQCISFAESKISDENNMKLVQISIINHRGRHIFEWGEGKYSLPIQKYVSKDFCTDSKNILIWTVK